MNKKAFEFSFNWIFALIVGAAIIFLAIFTISQLIKTDSIKQDTELGKELGIILIPLEVSFEESKLDRISMPSESRLFNECKTSGAYGSQEISVATKSLNDEWQKPGFQSAFKNKYLFSEKVIEGENYYTFSKPFEMPFKVANLIYLWPDTKTYCFINPPKEIEEELKPINNIIIDSCSQDSIKVCFTSSGCDIDISLDASGKIKGSLKKKANERVYFDSTSLLYAAIFSDSEIYECHLKRLMKRTSELSWIYYSKAIYLSQKGCSSNLESDLSNYANKTLSLNASLQIRDLSIISENIRRKNNDLLCKLF